MLAVGHFSFLVTTVDLLLYQVGMSRVGNDLNACINGGPRQYQQQME